MAGIMNEQIEKFYSDLILKELPEKKIVRLLAKFIVPIVVRKADDNLLEKLPSPWKEYTTQFSTSLYLALQDGNMSDEELSGLVDLCVSILNEKIDVPLLTEDDEAAVFQSILKTIALIAIKHLRRQ